jgi:hypothetical protein
LIYLVAAAALVPLVTPIVGMREREETQPEEKLFYLAEADAATQASRERRRPIS